MIDPRDEKWLKNVLGECFKDNTENIQDEKTLISFRILITNLVKNVEQNLKQVQSLWKSNPNSKELEEKLDILAKHLFYLRRFCQGKIEQRD